MSVSITVNIGENWYDATVMTIKRADMGIEDYNVFSVSIELSGDHTGVVLGGYALDDVPDKDDKDRRRRPTAYGMDYIMQILAVCEVSSWKKLEGTKVLALWSQGNSGWGGAIQGIANLHGTKVFDPKLHAESWKT